MILNPSDLKIYDLLPIQQSVTATVTGAALDVSKYEGWAAVHFYAAGLTAVTGALICQLQQDTAPSNMDTSLDYGSTTAFVTGVNLWTAAKDYQTGSPTLAFSTVTETAANATCPSNQTKYIHIGGMQKYLRARLTVSGASPQFWAGVKVIMVPKNLPPA